MRWWLTVGLLLQGLGLVLAIVGIAATKGDLFPARPLPHRRAWAWFRRNVLRRRGPAVTLQPHDLTSRTSVDSPTITTLPPPPGPDETAAQWGAYLERKIDNLARLRERDEREWSQRTDALRTDLGAERDERVAEVARLAERIGVAVGGEGGRGLDLAWWGLVITLVGTGIAGVAGIIGA